MTSLFSGVVNLLKEPCNAVYAYMTADAKKKKQEAILQNPSTVIGYGLVTDEAANIIRDFITRECHVPASKIVLVHDGDINHHRTADAFGHLDQTLIACIRIGTGDLLNIHNNRVLTPAQKFIIAHEIEHLVKGHSLNQDIDIKKSSKASLLAWGVCVVALPSLGFAGIPLSYVVGCTAGKIARFVSFELSVQKDEDDADDFAKTISPEIIEGGIECIQLIQEGQKKRKASLPSLIGYIKGKMTVFGYPSPLQYCKDWFADLFIANNGDNYLNLSHLSSRRITRLLAK